MPFNQMTSWPSIWERCSVYGARGAKYPQGRGGTAGWGHFSLGRKRSAVIPRDFASVSTPTSGTINFSSIVVRRTSAFRAAQCGTQRIARDSAPPKRTFRDQILGETVCVPGSV